MIIPEKYSNKSIAILGLGKTGRAALSSFNLAGAKPLIVWDDNSSRLSDLPCKAQICNYENMDWGEIELLLCSPGIDQNHPMTTAARLHGCNIKSDIEVLWETESQANFLGITGTNGKSTTTALIAHILTESSHRNEVGGNLGIPALSLSHLSKNETYVLELSSYQLALNNQLNFDIALLLNISEDHIEHHGSLEAYIETKKSIFRQGRLSTAIICIDDNHCQKIYAELQNEDIPNLIPVSTHQLLRDGISVENGIIKDNLEPICDLQRTKALQGKHNWQNAAAAWAAARAIGIKQNTIKEALFSFTGLAHRMEIVCSLGNVTFINDSKATNINATSKALSIDGEIYWIAGGQLKGQDIALLKPYLDSVRCAFLFGSTANEIAEKIGDRVPFKTFRELSSAVKSAASHAASDNLDRAIVLLSPACASFDQFENFEARGAAFKQFVKALSSQTKESHYLE